MKKITLAAFCVILAAFTAACTRQASGGGAGGGSSGGSGQVTVRLLTDATGIDDKSFNAAACMGILQFYGDTWDNQSKRGVSYNYITAQTQDMYIPNIRQATDEQYDLIITTGFTFADALTEVAGGNPEQKYMIVDVNWVNLPNVLGAMYAEHEGSYLVGVAAALKARADNISNPRFGFIGGIAGSTITKFEVGYIQGILSVIPGAQIVDYYVGDWGKPELAKAQAKNWYDSGIYAIYSAAGASGGGTIAQAKEYRISGRNVWAIGVDSDQYEDGLYTDTESAVLTSMLKKVETSVVYALDEIADGSFTGETITFDLKQDGVGYSSANSAMTKDIIDRLEQAKAGIISGEIKIASTYAEARRLPGFPQGLAAKDDQ
ncbi:MAG: BMP family ABC transporter substrate-binding protein [Spirochaetaceae bacterium]|jgi:basic membrane protein A|nr:BMP family ABC transporter substrate-binding protein [Spirochaetaceae bacterium]